MRAQDLAMDPVGTREYLEIEDQLLLRQQDSMNGEKPQLLPNPSDFFGYTTSTEFAHFSGLAEAGSPPPEDNHLIRSLRDVLFDQSVYESGI